MLKCILLEGAFAFGKKNCKSFTSGNCVLWEVHGVGCVEVAVCGSCSMWDLQCAGVAVYGSGVLGELQCDGVAVWGSCGLGGVAR